jgi:two-component system CheB/CheR fusion protein
MSFATHALRLPGVASAERPPLSDGALKKIFSLLRNHTGHDFSQYKLGTIQRRIERRMMVHQVSNVEDYVKYLQQTPSEAGALFRDFLIGVTQFFRDADAFEALQTQAFDKILGLRPPDDVIRIWAAGCSTGEEAYSLAMVLQERMDALQKPHTVQIFATDIDSRAIAFARAGRYDTNIVADVSPQRLARFFSSEPAGTGYRVHKSLRDMLVFSEQDVVKDPPFSKLDLVSCRNLMIYFGVELQRKLIPMFHYALNPEGLLFLGNSEGIGDFVDLFEVLDRKAKLYQRKDAIGSGQRILLSRFDPAISPGFMDAPGISGKVLLPAKLSLRELTERCLLNHFAVAAALVNGNGDILYLHGRAGVYLELHAGEMSVNNVLKMARPGLRIELANALRQAQTNREAVHMRQLQVQTNAHHTSVDLTVQPVHMVAPNASDLDAAASARTQPLFLVILEECDGLLTSAHEDALTASATNEVSQKGVASLEQQRIAVLMAELRAKEEYIQTNHEELESANEELKSSNEEMQSVNEELQSTNEEMETSKEELQSLNEELATVNNELHAKVMDLSRANNDMNNLLAGTGVATVFLDQRLNILRFTPTASLLINLIDSDVGRPVGHIVSNLVGYEQLLLDAKSVLDTLVVKEAQVQTMAGRWFTMRIRPYRTLDNVIEGVVLTFEDITQMKQVQEELNEARELARLAVVVRDAYDAITVQNLEGRTLAWNPGAVRMYGWTESKALTMNIRERIPPGLREDSLAKLLQLSRSEVLEPYATQRVCSDGRVADVWITSTALMNDAGQMYAVATTERTRKG